MNDIVVYCLSRPSVRRGPYNARGPYQKRKLTMKSCPLDRPVECDERDRLDAAYKAARASQYELESELASQLTSPSKNIAG